MVLMLYSGAGISAILTVCFLGHLDGLGIGTVLAAFTMGKMIGMIGDWMDQRFQKFPWILRKNSLGKGKNLWYNEIHSTEQ